MNASGWICRPAVTTLAVASLCACADRADRIVLRLSEPGARAFELTLAPADDVIAAAWHEGGDDWSNIVIRLVDPGSRWRSDAQALTDHAPGSGVTASEPSIAELPGCAARNAQSTATAPRCVAVAWYEHSAGDSYRAHLIGWSASAGELWRVPLGTAGRQSRNPVVVAGDDRLLVAWIERESGRAGEVLAAWFGADGRPLNAPLTLGVAGTTTWNLNAAVDANGDGYVVWSGTTDTRADELYLVRVHAAGTQRWRISADDGFASAYPDIAIRDDRFAITWFDERDGNYEVYVAIGTLAEIDRVAGSETRITHTPGASIGAYLAWNGESIGLAWSETAGDGVDIRFVELSPSGQAPAAPENVSRSPGYSMIPAILPWREHFIVAWNDVEGHLGHTQSLAARSSAMLAALPD